MCLGVPGQIEELFVDNDLAMARVRFGGVKKTVCVEHVPDARPGDYVLVHVGFALSRIDEAEAARIFEYLREMNELAELSEP